MKPLGYILLGIALLLVVKYGIVGLGKWNQALHPERKDDPTGIFYRPFLGVLT